MGLGPSDLFEGKGTEEGSTPMASGTRNHLARLFDGESVGGMTDGELLDRFTTRRGATAESAFEALVARHSPMVARVCRGLLRDEHDVEDAFQATFLVLVRRAGSIGEGDLLAPWLYGVAHRVARKARAVALRRRGREGGPAGIDPPARLDPSVGLQVEVGPVLHEEVNRLPEKYRRPIILCHLQGLTHAEAARELAWPVGTVSVRLVRARKILADRLSRRGVTTSATLVATSLATEATAAALAPSWIQAAAVAALAASSGLPLSTATAAASAGALTLARRTSMMMLLSSWKWFAVPLTVALATTTGAVLVGSGGPGDDPRSPSSTAPAQAKLTPSADPQGGTETKLGSPLLTPRLAEQAAFDQTETDFPTVYDLYPSNVDALAKFLTEVQHHHPDAIFQINMSNGKFRLSGRTVKDKLDLLAPAIGSKDIAGPQASHGVFKIAPPSIGSKDIAGPQASHGVFKIAQPELAVALTGQESRVIGQPIEYKLTVANSGTVPANAVQITATLPREGGKLAQGPLSLGANFDPKDRRLIWRIAQLEPGQSVERKFLYETIGSGQYRCVAEVVSEPFRATKEMITEVEKPPVVEPPVIALDEGRFELGPIPPGYFDLPASKSNEPGVPQPVKIGQTVQIEVLEALPGRPLTGNRVVRPDGTISLGFYGDLLVVGLNRDQIKVKLIERLRIYLNDSLLGLFGQEHDAQGNAEIRAIPPVRSNRVFVDDQPESSPAVLAAKEATAKRAATAPPRPVGGPIPVKVGQILVVEVLETLPGRPIMGERVVRPDGTISLGFYGDLAVAGLTRGDIKVKVVEHLRKFLDDEMLGLRGVNPRTGLAESVPPARTDRVFVADDLNLNWDAPTEPTADGKVQVGQLLDVEVLEATPGRPITGTRIVRPDGTIGLGFHGDLPVVNLTRGEIKVKVIELLQAKVGDEALGLVKVDAQGGRKAVAPIDSDRVFVNDLVRRWKPENDLTARGLREAVADLNEKLDRALGDIDRLRRDAKRQPKPTQEP